MKSKIISCLIMLCLIITTPVFAAPLTTKAYSPDGQTEVYHGSDGSYGDVVYAKVREMYFSSTDKSKLVSYLTNHQIKYWNPITSSWSYTNGKEYYTLDTRDKNNNLDGESALTYTNLPNPVIDVENDNYTDLKDEEVEVVMLSPGSLNTSVSYYFWGGYDYETEANGQIDFTECLSMDPFIFGDYNTTYTDGGPVKFITLSYTW